jgi:hypothetical protein
MFAVRLVLVALLSAMLVSCCGLSGPISLVQRSVGGSGEVITHQIEVVGFDALQVGWGFEVDVRQGETYAVTLRIDEALDDYVIVEHKGRTLQVTMQEGRTYRGTRQLQVTMPELVEIGLSGGSKAELSGFNSERDLSVHLSGGSVLEGDIRCGDADIHLSGGSRVKLRGAAGDLAISGSGGSHVELGEWPVRDADVSVSGGGEVTVDPSGRLDVHASGGAHIYYRGSPTLGTVDTSGGSEVRAR